MPSGAPAIHLYQMCELRPNLLCVEERADSSPSLLPTQLVTSKSALSQ
jgi:hypothetical protein